MLRINKLIVVVALTMWIGELAIAQDVFIYPNKNQNKEQQEKDKYDCYQWAKGETGFDPSQPRSAGSPPPQSGQAPGGAGRGLVRGAVGGAVVGAIAGDTGKGAAIGAASGGLIGGMRRRDYQQKQAQAHQQQQQQQASDYNAMRASYNRAYAACLEGRGYTVK